MSKEVSEHYDGKYFAWQSPIGDFGGWADQTKFVKFIRPDMDVLDFGCGGGYLLRAIECNRRVGIEVNPDAIEVARTNGIEVYPRTRDVPDDYVDLIISNHSLEHTLRPFDELELLHKKLRRGGRIVVVVPCESIWKAYRPGNIGNHLYSWSPNTLGNLLAEAGFKIVECKPYMRRWPPGGRMIAKIGGRFLFELAGWIYAKIDRRWFQVRVVATK